MGMLEVEMGISAGKRKVETSGRDVKFEASVEEREDVDEGSGLVILVALVLCDMLGTKEWENIGDREVDEGKFEDVMKEEKAAFGVVEAVVVKKTGAAVVDVFVVVVVGVVVLNVVGSLKVDPTVVT